MAKKKSVKAAPKKDAPKKETLTAHLCDGCTKDPDSCESSSMEMDDAMEKVIACEDIETGDASDPEVKDEKMKEGEKKSSAEGPKPAVMKNAVVRGNIIKAASLCGNAFNIPGEPDGKWATIGPVASIDFLGKTAKVLIKDEVVTVNLG